MRNHSERIEVQLMLLQIQSPESNEVQITYDVTASALVREIGRTDREPGEILVEDIEIDEVRGMSVGFGRFGNVFSNDTPIQSMVAIERQRRADYLNSEIDDRDDWTEQIQAAVIAKHDMALAVY